MVNKGPFLEFLNEDCLESGANTYTEVQISTPCSKTEELAMLIHKITYDFDELMNLQSADALLCQLCRTTQSGILDMDNSEQIDKAGIIADVLTSGGGPIQNIIEHHFNPPILYAKSKIFFSVKGISQSAARECSVRIGYTLEKVDKDAFIDALVED